ncbi:MAG TPA: oligosaccharide flippase family protein [Hyphomicrobium sp.]|uniref:oligosaccharide flippase family protein n=1 Tax=Hyphomicrobium sp. TaxID=82 RepID=UPI002C51082F|nr:oligosaccharide flippase family protein [Hyphomicrobium sp.]HRN87721.1 oligosaccharide flippase family protein [Hyphomicrobium sp.]
MLVSRLDALFRNKVSSDIAWTTASFAVLAASGIVINLVVAYFRNAADLGVFNLAYSVYIIASQIAAFGIHYSVLRSAAHEDRDKAKLGAILGSAVIAVVVLGIVFAGAIYAAEPLFARIFSERAGHSIAIAALGIALFPVTKVLISFLNGLRHMKAFSVLQAVRYITVAAVVTAFAMSDLPFEYATFCFLIAELITLVGATAYIWYRRLVEALRVERKWLERHISFGSKGLVAGMFGEINTRVDVLIIGYFLSEREVGIYSFAAMLLDGLYHLLAMVRVNFNPLLVQAIRDDQLPDAQKLLRLSKRYAPLVMSALAMSVVVFYWFVTAYLVPERGLQEGLVVLIILLGGLVLTSGLIPFDNLLLVSGYPGYQTLQQMTGFIVNVIGNVALIPVFGLEGAAMGTAASYIAAVTVLALMSYRLFGWNLLTNTVRSPDRGAA